MAQQTPTADPVVTFAGYESEGHGDGRLIRAIADEQAWGGQYTVEIDDSGNVGVTVSPGDQVTLSFNDYDLILWVENIESAIREGKQTVLIHCIDIWGLLVAYNASLVASDYNQSWQEEERLETLMMPDEETMLSDVPALYNPLLANGDMTIWEVIQDISSNTGISITKTDDDGIVNTAKPPISISNARTGLRQLMDMTTLYLKKTGTGLTIVVKGGSLVALADAWFEATGQGAIIPNKVTFWAYTLDGTDWGSGSAITTDPTVAQTIERHYLVATLDSKNKRSQAQLEQLAQATLDKLEQECSLGSIVAPLDDAIQLFDQVTGDDVTGYAHRVVREYDRGVYRITVQLNGATGGYTSPGADEPKPLPGVPIRAPTLAEWNRILPKAIQGYHHDLAFTATDQDTVTWTGGGTITFYDGTTQAIATGSYDLPNSSITYLYFDLDSASPTVLKHTTDYPSVMTMKTGLLCMVQKGSAVNIKATVIPSYGKEPLITPDVINMTGMVNYDYGDGKYLQHILNTQITAGYLNLTCNTYKSGEWYDESGVEISADIGIIIKGDTDFILSRAGYYSYIYPTSEGYLAMLVDQGLEVLGGWATFYSTARFMTAVVWGTEIGSIFVRFDDIYCDVLHVTNEPWDVKDDLAIIRAIKPKADNPEEYDKDSLPLCLLSNYKKEKKIAKRDLALREEEAYQQRSLEIALQEETTSPKEKKLLEQRLSQIGDKHDKKLQEYADGLSIEGNNISVGNAIGLLLGAVKQIGDKLEELEGRIDVISR